jgi:hypothetical protein
MPPPTSSLKPGPGAAKANGKKSPVPVSANGAAAKEAPLDGEEKKLSGKPDQARYNSEQEAYSKDIAAVKTKLVRMNISASTGC